jgi:hypothetical protein
VCVYFRIARGQIEAIKKMVGYAMDGALSKEGRQEEAKRKCLERWRVPLTLESLEGDKGRYSTQAAAKAILQHYPLSKWLARCGGT